MAGLTLLVSAGREAIVAAAKHLGFLEADQWTTERLVEFCDFLDETYRKYYPRFKRTGSDSFYIDLLKGLLHHQSFTTIFGYRQRFTGDPGDQSTLRACAATVGQANTAGRVNMALDELELGVRMKQFRDGPAPDYDGKVLQVSEETHGCSLRFQTHDSVAYCINWTHPKWQVGVERIFEVMTRPVLCKGRIINVGIEADVAINWAHDAKTVDGVPDIDEWLKSIRS
jgi:hypothetical protein